MKARTGVHCTFITDVEATVPALNAWLSAADREQSQQYRQPQRRLQYLAGRGLVRWLLHRYWQMAAEDSIITRQENGAPLLLVQGQQWQCSISHSHNHAIVAVSPAAAPIGVDVERIAPRKQLVRLLRTPFMAGVDSEHLVSFFQRWTLAEAVTKAEQGLLLEVLKRSSETYLPHACFQQHSDYLLCCYSPGESCTIQQFSHP
ncbi:hypothetical protein J6I75_09240 [Pseudidiomarina sp. 1APP75-27a]|uniref:4'-phosphopantetheinyl transferase family protein n=1 Tax=Pseudidiomarina terrestris TaxID=2820060 RepID=UPI002B0600B3|nr:hypothetical protein [Pseudidiomarina sp. 1APP75-27a]MEA3588536.1 hypothetical protein [Pseudidiomarina sp. 1APP75-27a]